MSERTYEQQAAYDLAKKTSDLFAEKVTEIQELRGALAEREELIAALQERTEKRNARRLECPFCETKLEEDTEIRGYALWTCPNRNCTKSYRFKPA